MSRSREERQRTLQSAGLARGRRYQILDVEREDVKGAPPPAPAPRVAVATRGTHCRRVTVLAVVGPWQSQQACWANLGRLASRYGPWATATEGPWAAARYGPWASEKDRCQPTAHQKPASLGTKETDRGQIRLPPLYFSPPPPHWGDWINKRIKGRCISTVGAESQTRRASSTRSQGEGGGLRKLKSSDSQSGTALGSRQHANSTRQLVLLFFLCRRAKSSQRRRGRGAGPGPSTSI